MTAPGLIAWADVRADTIGKFRGELPKNETEQQIIDEFERRPVAVLRMVDEVAVAVRDGQVRSGWAVLRKRLADSQPTKRNPVVDASDRDKRVRQAEAWVRNAGVYCDRFEEVDSALFDEGFGERGQTLRPWRNDDDLRDRMRRLWETVRPDGQKAELEQEERLAAWAERRRMLAEAAVAKPATVVEADPAWVAKERAQLPDEHWFEGPKEPA